MPTSGLVRPDIRPGSQQPAASNQLRMPPNYDLQYFNIQHHEAPCLPGNEFPPEDGGICGHGCVGFLGITSANCIFHFFDFNVC